MAFPSKNLILTVLVFLLADFGTSKGSLVDDVCSHSNPDPKYCISTLGSGSDLSSLGKIAIDTADNIAGVAISVLNSIIGGTSDPTAKKHYISCFNSYNATSNNLVGSHYALQGKDYEKLSVQASAALAASRSCDKQFSPEPQGVQVQTLCSALVYIASQLKQGH